MNFKMNRRIEILTLDDKKIGNSTVQDEDESFVFINIPFDSKDLGSLKPGDRIKALYCDEDNRLFSFETEVFEFIKDQIPLVKIFKPKEFEIIQRRQHVRVPVLLDVEYIKLDEFKDIRNKSIREIKEMYDDKEWEKGYSFDLSAGGMGIIMHHSVETDDKFLIIVDDESFNLALTGKAMRVFKNKDSRNRLYRVGISFTNLNYSTEEKIIRFIFLKMREQLKVR